MLRPELAAVLGAERFLQEIHICARLDHPHIVTLIDSGERQPELARRERGRDSCTWSRDRTEPRLTVARRSHWLNRVGWRRRADERVPGPGQS